MLAVLLRAPNAGPEAVARRAWALVETAARRPAARGGARGGRAGARVAAPARARGSRWPRTRAARLLGPGAAGRRRAPCGRRSTARCNGWPRRACAGTCSRCGPSTSQDGAVLVVDNASGEVLAYVGGSGDLGSARHVDGIRARRQAGSTLKPFLYAVALDRRLLTAASLLEDTPLDARGGRRALPAAELRRGLHAAGERAHRAGVVAQRARRARARPRRRGGGRGAAAAPRLRRACASRGDYYGPSMALGSADVSLWELVNAYRALARGGTWSPLRLGADEAGAPRAASIPIARRSSSRASSPTARAEASRSASRTRSPRASGPRSRPAPARRCATTGASATRAATRWACGWATSGASPCET